MFSKKQLIEWKRTIDELSGTEKREAFLHQLGHEHLVMYEEQFEELLNECEDNTCSCCGEELSNEEDPQVVYHTLIKEISDLNRLYLSAGKRVDAWKTTLKRIGKRKTSKSESLGTCEAYDVSDPNFSAIEGFARTNGNGIDYLQVSLPLNPFEELTLQRIQERLMLSRIKTLSEILANREEGIKSRSKDDCFLNLQK